MVPCHPHGISRWSNRLWPGPDPTIAAMWGVEWQMEDLSFISPSLARKGRREKKKDHYNSVNLNLGEGATWHLGNPVETTPASQKIRVPTIGHIFLCTAESPKTLLFLIKDKSSESQAPSFSLFNKVYKENLFWRFAAAPRQVPLCWWACREPGV